MAQKWQAHIVMLEMLEEFELAVGAFGQDELCKWLDDLLDRDIGARDVVFRGAATGCMSVTAVQGTATRPGRSQRAAYQTRPNAPGI